MVTFEGKTFASWQEARASIVAKPEAPVQAVAVAEAPSKTRAAQWARAVAKERDWRFMEVREK